MIPAQADAVSRLLEEKFGDEADRYEDGKCPEMALGLAQVLPKARICVGKRQWREHGQVVSNPLSHVVVLSGSWDFDARGNWASSRWEERWEGNYSDEPDEEVSFLWQPISPTALTRHVKKYRENDPEIDWDLVTRLKKNIGKLLSPCFLEHWLLLSQRPL